MKSITGTNGTAIIYTDIIEEQAIQQVKNVLEMPYSVNAHIRMMPDIHAGYGCVIGTTMRMTDKVCPSLIGVDIGCGIMLTHIDRNIYSDKELSELSSRVEYLIRKDIPSGFGIRNDYTEYDSSGIGTIIEDIKCPVNIDKAKRSLGTLGGGNHFTELDKGDDGIYLSIHSGSRHLGLEIANYYQNLAISHKKLNHDEIKSTIEKCKAEGRTSDIEKEIDIIRNRYAHIPNDLMYLEGQEMEDYLHDMRIAQLYAKYNREVMSSKIIEELGGCIDSFQSIHNYIDDRNIIRKGATNAEKGKSLVIPMNMRDGCLVCVGKGNEDWNCSAPHGAGRLMSRKSAMQKFSLMDYAKSMDGINTWSICEGTKDECPMAYKPMESIIDNIQDTVEIKSIIKPFYNFKAKNERD